MKLMLARILNLFKPFNGRDQFFQLQSDYEVLIRLARRCAYDLGHAVDHLPEHDVLRRNGINDRATYWIRLFTLGSPGKDYRIHCGTERDDAVHAYEELEEWCKVQGLNPPEFRKDLTF